MNTNRLREGIDHHGALTSLETKTLNETFIVWLKMSQMSALRKTAGCFVFLCFLLSIFAPRFCAAAHAASDVIAYHSPYVWRTDGTGDFVLPVIAERMEYISQPVSVKGTITSITATWDATGPVAVLVSADAGLHYTPVVNGVPLVSGFAKGETLKWKVVLGAETALSCLTIAFTSANGIAGTFGEPELSGFLYRKQFRISGSSSGALYNYQVLVRVGESPGSASADVFCNGHILADFNDIRFASADGETLLAHALAGVEGKKPNRIAVYFVRVPQIPQDGVPVFLYYGQPVARSLSSPQDTFDFYEDFTALNGTIDPEKWSLTLGTGGSAKVTYEGLLLDAATLTAKAFEFKDGVIEYAADAETGYETRLIARDPEPGSATDVTLVAYASALDGAQHCLVVDNIVKANDAKPIPAKRFYGFRLIADKDNLLTFERYDENFSEKQAAVSYHDKEGPAKGFLALKTAGLGLGRSLTKFRWIRSRKHASPEPAVDPASSTAAEESPALPIFSNVVLDAKKDLVLAAGAKTGQYITLAVKADFAIRILVSVWRGVGVSVDISADGGKSYRKNCIDNSYYYASRGDFALGRVMRGRLNLKKESSSAPYAEYALFSYKAGSIVLLEPNGGSSVAAGAMTAISWTAWDYETSYPMKLEYSPDAGKTYQLITPQALNTGSYAWQTPDIKVSGALVRISDFFDPQVFDVSDKFFSIGADANFNVSSDEKEDLEGAKAHGFTGEEQEGPEALGQDADKLKDTAKAPVSRRLYELLIKIGDTKIANPDVDKRAAYKEGDIVMIRPAGHPWGSQEREKFAIIQVYLTEKEAEELISPKQGADGRMVGRRKYKVDVRKQKLIRGRGRILKTKPLVEVSAVEAK